MFFPNSKACFKAFSLWLISPSLSAFKPKTMPFSDSTPMQFKNPLNSQTAGSNDFWLSVAAENKK